MAKPASAWPWPYNPSAPRPGAKVPLPAPTPGNTNIGAVNDPWPPKWTKPVKGKAKGLLPGVLGKASGPLAVYFAANEFGEALRLDEYINGHPLLNMGNNHIWGWTNTCSTISSTCACGPPSGQIGCVLRWTHTASSVCTTLCTIPTGTFDWLSANTRPYNVSPQQYGYVLQATATIGYIRVREVWTRNPGSDTTPGLLKYTNLRNDPGILPNAFPDPAVQPYPGAQPGTSPLPNIIPEGVPVWAPWPLPAPLPYATPRTFEVPGIEPTTQPRKWPSPAPRPTPGALPNPAPGVVVAPNPNPNLPPNVSYQPFAGPRARGRYRPRAGTSHRAGIRALSGPPSHKHQPPRDKKSERKFAGNGAVKFGKAFANAVTESLDVVDAAWNALPAGGGWQTKVPGTYTTPQQKFVDVAKAWHDDKFNAAAFLGAFAKNLAVNQAVDAGAGAVGSTVGKSAKKLHGVAGTGPHGDLPIGWAAGPAL